MNLEWRSGPEHKLTWASEPGAITVLTWSRESFPLALTWIGPNEVRSKALVTGNTETQVAAVFGPPGEKGNDGSEGPRGQAGEPGYAIIPDVLDGGNF